MSEPRPTDEILTVERALEHARTQHGRSLAELNREMPLLIVCLMETGSPFARDALAKMRAVEAQLEREGARLILVYGDVDGDVATLVSDFRLQGVDRVEDPGGWMLRALRVWHGQPATVRIRLGAGRSPWVGEPAADAGIFLVHRGAVVEEYPHSAVFGRRGGGGSSARRIPSPF
jgi:hypothetical protein